MRLAFFSPLNPQKSGISDYSEELLPHLAARASVDLFVDGFRPANEELLQSFPCFDYKRDPGVLRRLSEYDAVLYHMGNDPRYHAGIYQCMREHPGIVVFHDFAFQFFFFYLAYERGRMDIYLEELEACHGIQTRAQAEAALSEGLKPPHLAEPLAFPLNRRLAQMAEAIIVHSEWSRSRFAQIVPAAPIAHIRMHAVETGGKEVGPTRSSHTGNEVVQLASFGHATPEKGIERTLRALAALKDGPPFHYTLVGEVSPYFNFQELVRELGLKERVTVTGYVPLEEFKRRIARTDIAINLRESTVGETSASLCRIMAAGVPAIVSDMGWFSELPDSAVVKIEMDSSADRMLSALLKRLIEDGPLRARIGANARRYAHSSHAINNSADSYISFIKEVLAGRVRRRFVRGVSHELARLGIGDRDEDFLREVAAKVAELAPADAFNFEGGEIQTIPDETAQSQAVETAPDRLTEQTGRLRRLEGIDYKRAALEYPQKLDAGRRHYLLTKPFDNLARRPPKYLGDGMDEETYRHFCDFANLTRALKLPPGSRILDVGCGSGWLSEYLARLGYEVCGIDISPDLVEMARERLRRVPFPVDQETALRYRFATHDIESAPLPETFDAIICYDSLHHFQDERAVVRHLAMMLDYGGLLFILEGDRPQEGSAGERELLDTMREFGTLESPFSRRYLDWLLAENGFAVIADYVSVNGLFQRGLIKDQKMTVSAPEVTYLLCKKVVERGPAQHVPDSREAAGLRARLTLVEPWEQQAAPGASLKLRLAIENTGEALWLTGPAELKGSVMLALKIMDGSGGLVFESHGEPPIGRALARGESVRLALEIKAPLLRGQYTLKLDLVAQHVCWFEQCGSAPLVLPLLVR
ncbi:MAG TPA: methyltransferase domain-containing protein [Pyrinomonadaceae bacterium]|jgi:2-polyprenyl-3-methyl-5-hydroxy-6-metoxy-1,4-benzoquinol methylase/glycosyltransferase involved in cell wall biosynthesis